MRKRINFLLEKLLKELEEREDYLSFLLFKNYILKLRNEIEEKFFHLLKNEIIGYFFATDNFPLDERKFLSYLSVKYREFDLSIFRRAFAFTVSVTFFIDNFINKILEKFNCEDKFIDKKKLKEDIFNFWEKIEKELKSCDTSIVCLYFKDLFDKYNIILDSDIQKDKYKIFWDLYYYPLEKEFAFLGITIFFHAEYGFYYVIDEEGLKKKVKSFMDKIFSMDNKGWENILKEFRKSPYFTDFRSYRKNVFLSHFCEFILYHFEKEIFDFLNLEKEENLVKINEKTKNFIEELVILLKKFKEDMESGSIINFIFQNSKLRKNLETVVSRHCKKKIKK